MVNHGAASKLLQGMKDVVAEIFELPLEEKNKIIETYSSEVEKVGKELLSSITGMKKDALLGLHQELVQAFTINYYPPCSTPEKVLGLTV
ncbi:putative non-heme dioxygenase domain, isopenicillin N synthase [Rosa chinensis]|uniref:Putative non-heme dioxygenase domain, isopenicillin N synthase n=1 Tax=Rosa chinensis TaxID=74649 RepID=A0A2P6R9V9_ROSCH|nr:putative non-heme dioxygenase domain, isopenicillin N synthase [Rosa chinensis]